MNRTQMKSWNEFYRTNGGTEQNAVELYQRFCNPHDVGHQGATPGDGLTPNVDSFIERSRNKFKRK